MPEGYVHKTLYCRYLRRRQTPAEKVMWANLRNRQLKGYKFVRQYPIGDYIVDFFCFEKQLAIELDGEIHHDPEVRDRDQNRQKIIEAKGVKFLRFPNRWVLQDTPDVLNIMEYTLHSLS